MSICPAFSVPSRQILPLPFWLNYHRRPPLLLDLPFCPVLCDFSSRRTILRFSSCLVRSSSLRQCYGSGSLKSQQGTQAIRIRDVTTADPLPSASPQRRTLSEIFQVSIVCSSISFNCASWLFFIQYSRAGSSLAHSHDLRRTGAIRPSPWPASDPSCAPAPSRTRHRCASRKRTFGR